LYFQDEIGIMPQTVDGNSSNRVNTNPAFMTKRTFPDELLSMPRVFSETVGVGRW